MFSVLSSFQFLCFSTTSLSTRARTSCVSTAKAEAERKTESFIASIRGTDQHQREEGRPATPTALAEACEEGQEEGKGEKSLQEDRRCRRKEKEKSATHFSCCGTPKEKIGKTTASSSSWQSRKLRWPCQSFPGPQWAEEEDEERRQRRFWKSFGPSLGVEEVSLSSRSNPFLFSRPSSQTRPLLSRGSFPLLCGRVHQPRAPEVSTQNQSPRRLFPSALSSFLHLKRPTRKTPHITQRGSAAVVPPTASFSSPPASSPVVPVLPHQRPGLVMIRKSKNIFPLRRHPLLVFSSFFPLLHSCVASSASSSSSSSSSSSLSLPGPCSSSRSVSSLPRREKKEKKNRGDTGQGRAFPCSRKGSLQWCSSPLKTTGGVQTAAGRGGAHQRSFVSFACNEKTVFGGDIPRKEGCSHCCLSSCREKDSSVSQKNPLVVYVPFVKMSRRKIALVGGGNIGATLALLTAVQELGDVVMFDVVQGKSEGEESMIYEEA